MSSEITQQIKDRLRISDLVGRKVALKRKGHLYWGLCPFHHEKSSSFCVNDIKQFYHCFGCQEHGNIFDFLIKTEKLDFRAALEKLAKEAGITLSSNISFIDPNKVLYQINSEALKFFAANLSTNLKAQNYCQMREMNQDIIEKFAIGFADRSKNLIKYLTNKGYKEVDIVKAGLAWRKSNGDIIESFQDRLIFPIFNQINKVIAFGGRVIEASNKDIPKYKNTSETAIYTKKNQLYNLNRAKLIHPNNIIVAEGYMDVVALAKVGIENVVAPLGTAITTEQIKMLWRICNEPIFCFDGDEAGLKASSKVVDLILPILETDYSAQFVLLPEGKDPDDMIKEGQVEKLNKLLNKPISLTSIIWQKYVGDPEKLSPDQKAQAEKNLFKAINQISDQQKKAYYYDYFVDQVRTLLRRKNQFYKNGGMITSRIAEKQPPKTASIDANERIKIILVALMAACPDIFLDQSEFIGSLELKDQKVAENLERLLNNENVELSFINYSPYNININFKDDKLRLKNLFKFYQNEYFLDIMRNNLKDLITGGAGFEKITHLRQEMKKHEQVARELKEQLNTSL
ncbi:DNA primase [Rickettsiales endosymbiont of Stachyamoeba lipophora]|uniref:DNA primase n=1 Tax=Rickettsiales endosymbiont of Stachyamoeba lipophora TaxID=2486578 RepID=UPI000F646159|nr:DNA primase [Rickettsiales endosymbiont of Stachyamoeba lipophora]AZL15643.1 DNA primase [Rickettsiales endosymbiont of Stachyamoeba lipophora]